MHTWYLVRPLLVGPFNYSTNNFKIMRHFITVYNRIVKVTRRLKRTDILANNVSEIH